MNSIMFMSTEMNLKMSDTWRTLAVLYLCRCGRSRSRHQFIATSSTCWQIIWGSYMASFLLYPSFICSSSAVSTFRWPGLYCNFLKV